LETGTLQLMKTLIAFSPKQLTVKAFLIKIRNVLAIKIENTSFLEKGQVYVKVLES
jgi:hypothetical protein